MTRDEWLASERGEALGYTSMADAMERGFSAYANRKIVRGLRRAAASCWRHPDEAEPNQVVELAWFNSEVSVRAIGWLQGGAWLTEERSVTPPHAWRPLDDLPELED